MNERLVWIDCEMTGLDLGADALIEVAALVTDFDLNVLGEGIDLIIKPPAEALEQMIDFVRTMHETLRPARRARAAASRWRRPRQQVLAYIKEHCPDGSRPPLAGNTVATDRAFLARDMPSSRRSCTTGSSTSPRSRSCRGAGSPAPTSQAPAKRGNHRALADIQESIEELRYYREAVFVPAPGPDTDDRPRDRGRHGGSLTGLGSRRPRFRHRRLIALHFSSVRRSARGTHGGYSSAGRAPPCGGGCRGFKSRYSPQRIEPLTCGDAVRGSDRLSARRTRR